MTTCIRCNQKFDVDESRATYNAEFNGELDYDEEMEGEVCADCALLEAESNINQGRAIDMMNGEEDYDDEFVEKHL